MEGLGGWGPHLGYVVSYGWIMSPSKSHGYDHHLRNGMILQGLVPGLTNLIETLSATAWSPFTDMHAHTVPFKWRGAKSSLVT